MKGGDTQLARTHFLTSGHFRAWGELGRPREEVPCWSRDDNAVAVLGNSCHCI